jgi:NitT/TauT family transport system substrate-binding protein
MMALPEIKSVADFKGKTVGVTRSGSSTDFDLRYLMQKNVVALMVRFFGLKKHID